MSIFLAPLAMINLTRDIATNLDQRARFEEERAKLSSRIYEESLTKFRHDLGSGFAKMGFYLADFSVHQQSFDVLLLHGTVVCPCGGMEFFRVPVVSDGDFRAGAFANANFAGRIIEDILTMFKEHIQSEVADGTLPKQWLERIAA